MKKLVSVLMIAVLAAVFSFASDVNAADNGQYVVVLKAPKYDIGNGIKIEAKACLFMMTDFAQKWAYFGLNKGMTTIYGGYVSDWSHEAIAFGAVKFAPSLNERFSALTDFHLLDNGNEVDIYNWMTIEYNGVLDQKPVYIGPHLESIRTAGVTKHWAGVHVGSPNLVEVGVYYRTKDDWSLRTTFVVQL